MKKGKEIKINQKGSSTQKKNSKNKPKKFLLKHHLQMQKPMRKAVKPASKLHNLKPKIVESQPAKKPSANKPNTPSYTAGIDFLVINNVPSDKVFYLFDGRVVRNLLELADMLETMDDCVFEHHANECKNDFANWINDVVGDKDLADELRLIYERDKAHVAVLRHVLRKVLPLAKKEHCLKIVRQS